MVQQYEAVGHAVRAVYTYSGMADVAAETHDPDYQSAVKSLWDNIVNKKYYITGGVGSGETSEGFGPDYSLRNNAYCEACSSCGEIFFQWKMNLAYHDAKYRRPVRGDDVQRAAGRDRSGGPNYYYTNPLDENALRTAWHVCPCCVGNIPRTLLMLPTWIYAKSAEGVYVNLFVGSTISLENVDETDVEMVQATDYPWSGKVAITVNPKARKTFTVFLRTPNRAVSKLYAAVPEANGISSLAVNGMTMRSEIRKGYAAIRREWNAGDRIDLTIPMKVQRIRANENVVADRGKVALRYGPLLYNIEKVDQDILKTLAASSPLTTEWKGDLLGGVVVVQGTFTDGSPMLTIPNYARMNREPAPATPVEAGTFPSEKGPAPPPVSAVWIKEA